VDFKEQNVNTGSIFDSSRGYFNQR